MARMTTAQRRYWKLEKRHKFLQGLVTKKSKNVFVKTATRNLTVSTENFSNLMTVGALIDDTVIMNYCYQFEIRDPKVHVIDCQFLSPRRKFIDCQSLSPEKKFEGRVVVENLNKPSSSPNETTLNRIRKKLAEKEILLVPLNILAHWVGIVVDIRAMKIYFVDSLDKLECRRYAEEVVLPILRKMLEKDNGKTLDFCHVGAAQQGGARNSGVIHMLTTFRRLYTSFKKTDGIMADLEKGIDEQKERLNIAGHLLFGIHGFQKGQPAPGFRPFDEKTATLEDILIE